MESERLIICACDLSQSSDRTVAQAGGLAAALGAAVELLHINVLRFEALPYSALSGTPAYRARELVHAQDQLERHRASLAERGVEATVNVLEAADAASAIVERARRAGAMMLVLGAHGQSGFKRFLIGNTAEHVARTADVPVLVTRQADNAERG